MNLSSAVIFTLVMTAAVAVAADTTETAWALKKTAFNRIVAMPKLPAALDSGAGIGYHAYPLRGRYRRAVFDSAAAHLLPFISRRGAAAPMTASVLFDCLDRGDSCAGARYIVLPLEVRTKTAEKKIEVQSFVNLDEEGNFIPSDTRRTLSNITIEMRCRFVVVDLRENARVFDAWYYARAGSDDAMRDGRQPAGKNATRSADDQSIRCVLYIIDKVKRHIVRKFG